MDDRRDDVDAWLQARVESLPPPRGTFELIRKRARRRKIRQAAVTAAAGAVVIAAIATVPQVVLNVGPNPPEKGVPVAGQTSSPAHRTAPHRTPATPPAPAPAATALPPVPANFAATSVTFVGTQTGWVLGQADIPGQCATQYCTSVARTDDAGASWYGVRAPVTGAPDGAAGVSQIRFLNTQDGWAFGPELWATHDGGQSWARIRTGGLRVTALETVGARAFAVWAHCTGTGQDFAAGCTTFGLYSSPASGDGWSTVPGAGAGADISFGGKATSAALVLTSSRGYLLTPSGILLTGPVDGTGSWQVPPSATPQNPLCQPGTAHPDGQPSGASLAASDSTDLVLVCAGTVSAGGDSQQKTLYVSQDSGRTWQRRGELPASGIAMSAAAQPGGTVIVATSAGLDVSGDGGSSWQRRLLSPAGSGSAGSASPAGPTGPAEGFAYAGMTTVTQGVAVPADAGQHAMWFTFDGGTSWQRSAIKGPPA